ncbi:winged helix-turn-helix domain-containing protein [Halobaculum lipolyticum]|uniref:Winged helix-turn-helix domain-containing protein n=1 Tax=Halobaculum lipolyticum TaxID=3032001 RepID=A0ABD5WGC0_9EURY|nr:helix-turn-helix domain-containing protein [Halobaculum sp. DT31]
MAGDHPSRRTFELLANEIRLRIITALGDASGRDGYATLAFSEIQRATDVDDSSQLTYHLGELRDEFLEKSDEGYTLTLAGIRAYQAIIAHRSRADVEVDPFAVRGTCESCGGGLEARYADGRAYVTCESCGDHRVRYPVDGRRIDPDTPETVLEGLQNTLIRDYTSMFNGICPYCGGVVAVEFAFDSEHWEAFDIATDDIPVHAACDDCSWFLYVNLPAVLRTTEPVQAFYAERGLDIWRELAWTDDFVWTLEAADRDPIRVRGFFEIDGDRLELVIDGDLDIVERRLVDGE